MFIHKREKELNFYDKLLNKSLNLFVKDNYVIVYKNGTERDELVRVTVVTFKVPKACISTVVVVASAIKPRVSRKNPKFFYSLIPSISNIVIPLF